jgi:predicted NAD/FAD-binding protein
VSGLSAAWLLSKTCDVTLYEKDSRTGGHANTVKLDGLPPVDTGFIVYNAVNYPNLVALFDHLGVETQATDMSFAVSLDGGRVEYGGRGLDPLIGRPSNLFRPRFLSMMGDLVRFYREAPEKLAEVEGSLVTLGEFLRHHGYGEAFCEDHLLPQAAAIWSAPCEAIRDFPAAAFIRFFENHGLLKLAGRPVWRTVKGGSRTYVEALLADYSGEVLTGRGARAVRRTDQGVEVTDSLGETRRYDRVVMAAHADQSLSLLADPTPDETRLLSAFRYTKNLAVLHTDESLAPRRKRLWSAWNYVGERTGPEGRALCVTYWMNLLQNLKTERPLLLTLNPTHEIKPDRVLHTETYEHPLFDGAAIAAQKALGVLQGVGGTYYCGAWMSSGFHEDGLQSGLRAAELADAVERPWNRPGQNARLPWLEGAAA